MILWELDPPDREKANAGQFVFEFSTIFISWRSLRSILFGGKFFLGHGDGLFGLFCCVSGFDRKTKKCLRILAIFLFFCQSLKHCRKNSKSPSPWPRWPPKNFPPKRILLRDLQKTKIVENSKTNWPALAFSRSGGSSSHKVKKTFWNFFEIFRKIKILYKNAFLFKGLEFWNILFLEEHRWK